MLPSAIAEFIHVDVLNRFTAYVKIQTNSDPNSKENPSTSCQLDLLRLLKSELSELGLTDIALDDQNFLWATLPANTLAGKEGFGLLAHVDTSPDQAGNDVNPQLHENWDGTPIKFPDDPELVLTVEDSPELTSFLGQTIITASGRTLLGADDKAGVAEIMCALAAFKQFPELPHSELRVCFTHDEEIGRGITGMDLSKLPRISYTMDAGYPGEVEDECFDAWKVTFSFEGKGVHPGYAKGRMVNAGAIAARFIAALPEWDTPEHSTGREGFIYLSEIQGNQEDAKIQLSLRDFEQEKNQARMEMISAQVKLFEQRYTGLHIFLEVVHQYENMNEILRTEPEALELAEKAVRLSGLEVIRKPIRGGTDGSLLSAAGHPTPNVFAGGMLFHSKKEWIALPALERGVETVIHLAALWGERLEA